MQHDGQGILVAPVLVDCAALAKITSVETFFDVVVPNDCCINNSDSPEATTLVAPGMTLPLFWLNRDVRLTHNSSVAGFGQAVSNIRI